MRIRHARGLPKPHSRSLRALHTLPGSRRKEPPVTVLSLVVSSIVIPLAVVTGAARQAAAPPADKPETFQVTAAIDPPGNNTGVISVPFVIHLDRFTLDRIRTQMTDGLKYGGYPGFVRALRNSPKVGYLEAGGQRFDIRWARQEPAANGRRITLVTDQPVYFMGQGRRGAKSTAGFEVAVIELNLDGAGRGDGSMAMAARVKPKDVTGIQIEDYHEAPAKLVVGGGRK